MVQVTSFFFLYLLVFDHTNTTTRMEEGKKEANQSHAMPERLERMTVQRLAVCRIE